jgi:hypothetical protein
MWGMQMKCKFTILCLVLFVCLAAQTAFADNNTVALQSIILDNFDGTEYTVDNETYIYDWKTVGSRYSTKAGETQYPRVGYIKTGPQALTRLAQTAGKEAISLGLQGSFDRHGYNWADIYPTVQGGDGTTPAEIPLWGRPHYIDIWVWGANLDYTLSAYIRDNRGIVHEVPMGSLRFTGWKNLRATVPAVSMVSTVLPRSTHACTFVKFRVTTNPNAPTVIERKQDGTIVPFDIYFAQLKVLNDTYETFYDGDELADPKMTDALWSGAGTASGQ